MPLDARTLRAKEKYEGKTFKTKDGLGEFTVLQFNSGSDIVIRFGKSDLIRHISSYDITRGITYPFAKSIAVFDTPQGELMGNHYKTKQGYVVEVIAVKSRAEVTVKFLDNFGYETTTTIQNIRKGEVRNPYHPNKFGGYLGEGPYNGDEYEWVYRVWYNMIMRAHESNYYAQHHGSYIEAYNNTIVDPTWLCYNTFATWYLYAIGNLNPNYTYEMDKDLFYRFYSIRTNGRKCYGPDTVALMPHDLNVSLGEFSNLDKFSSNYVMYELERNESLIQKAEFYFKENAIDERTYRCIVDSYKPKEESATNTPLNN